MKKFLQTLMLVAAMCVPWVSSAQMLSDYSLSVSNGTFTSIASTGTQLSFSSNDDGYATFNLPFAFNFGETALNQGDPLACSANGFIYLNQSSCSGTTASAIGTSYLAINALFNSDGHMGRHANAGAYYLYDATAGKLTIEYKGLGSYSANSGTYNYFAFQVALYSNGNIEFVYDSINWVYTSNVLRTFVLDGPNADIMAINGPWATPVVGASAEARPTDVLPTSGLTYTLTRPGLNSCFKPGVVTADNITSSSADLTWESRGASAWSVEYSDDLYFVPGSGVGTVVSASDSTITLTGLTSHTTYAYAIHAVCGGDTSANKVGTFTTRYACAPISSFAVAASGTTSAQLTWSFTQGLAENDPTDYVLLYGTDADNMTSENISGETSFMITGLDPATEYIAKVYADCGSSTGDTSTITFKTKGLGCMIPDTTATVAVVTGTGTSQQSGVPVISSWGNTFSETIFTAEELTDLGLNGGPIDSIYYIWTSGGSYDKQFTILMGHTSKAQFDGATASDWVPMSELTQVYTGLRPAGTSGSVGYPVEGFSWDGSSNLVIASFMNQHGGSQSSSGFYGLSTQATTYKTLYKYQDSNPLDNNVTSNAPNSRSMYYPSVTLVGYDCLVASQCAAPTVVVDDIATTSIDISWAQGYQETSWDVEYRADGDTAWTMASAGESGQSLTIDQLTPNTIYKVRVTSLCSDESKSAVVTVRTACTDILDLPYVETFENNITGSGNQPLCWTSHSDVSISYPYVRLSGSNKDLYMYASSLQTYASMSPIDESLTITDLQVKFDAMKTSTTSTNSSTLIVGVCDVAGDLSTFVAVDTLRNIPTTYTEYQINLDQYTGTGRYITFVSEADGGASYNYVAIDNVTVREIPVCLDPDNFRVTAVTTTTADLAWTENGDASSWVIEYATAPFTPGNSEGTEDYAYDTIHTLTGLDSATTYYVYMHADCGGDQSADRYLTFTTLAASPATVPYICNFEADGANGWDFVNGTMANQWFVGPAASNGGSRGLYVSNDNGVSNSYTNSSTSIVYATRAIDIVDTGVYMMGYDWRAYGEGSWDYLRAWLAPAADVQALTAGILPDGTTSTYSFVSTQIPGWISLDGGSNLNLQSTWQSRTNEFSISEAGLYYIVMMWGNDGSGGTSPAGAIDNVRMRLNTCPSPTDFAVSNAVADTVSLTWTAAPGTTAWQVAYGPAGFNVNDEDLMPEYVAETNFTVTGLPMGYSYEFYVRTDCGSDYGDWMGPLTVMTGTHYSMTAAVDTLMGCGYIITDNGGDGEYAASSNNTLYLFPSDTNTETLTLTGWSYTESSYDYITIYDGIGTSGTVLYTDNGVSARQNFSVFSEEGAVTITFRSDGSVEYDGFEIVASCVAKPSCGKPTNVAATNVTNNSADVLWTDPVGYNSVTILWGINPSMDMAIDSAVVSGVNTYTITGLTGNTSYHAWVRGDCSEGASRVIEVAFTTDVDCAPVENLHVSATDYYAFGLQWDAPTDGEPATEYIVGYKLATATNWTYDTVADTYYYVGNLTPGTAYNYKVTTVCDTVASASAQGIVSTRSCGFEWAEGTTTNQYIPTYSLYNYSYTQQLYLASELATAGDSLTSISFYVGAPITRSNVWTVYLGNTTQSSYSSVSDYVAHSAMTQVFSGSVNTSSEGWVTLNFTTPFVRNHNQNLAVTVCDNTGSYTGGLNFRINSVSGNRSIYYYQDASAISPSAPSATYSGVQAVVNQIRLGYSDCIIPTCPAPAVFVNNIEQTSADIVWYPADDNASYTVSYREDGAETWTVAATDLNTNTYTLSGINAGLDYEVSVSMDCEGDTLVGTNTFVTACGRVAVPYTENFQGHDYGYYARNCWTVGTTSADAISSDNYPYVVSLSGDSENKLLLLYQGGYVIMPKADADLTDLQIRFTLLQGGDNVPLLFGLIDDPAAPISTMTVLDTLVRSNYTTESSYNLTYRFDNLTAADTGKYIAFWSAAGVNYSFLDNIVLEYIPACPSVDSAVASNITSTGATIDIYGSASSYVVEYGPRGFALGTGATMSVSGNTAQLSNLLVGTIYDAYVYSICGTDTSIASNVVRFTTECDVFNTLPYALDFENVPAGVTYNYELPTCWAYEMNATGTYATGTYLPSIYYSTSTTNNSSGTHCLRLAGNAVVALPEFAAPINTLMMQWHEYASSSYYILELGVVDSVTPGFAASFTPIDTVVSGNTSAHDVTVYLTDYANYSGRLAFRNSYNGTSEYSYHYIDDILVDLAPSCIVPQRVSLTGLSATTADIAWRSSQAQNYQFGYRVHGDTVSALTISSDTTFHHYTFNGLTPNTEYDVYVRGICGNDTTDWSDALTFTTLCPAIDVPYSEDFDNLTTSTTGTTGVFPDCWTYVMTGSPSYQTGAYLPQVYYSSSNANSGSYSLRLYGVGYYALPQFSTPIDSLQLNFNYYISGSYYGLEVGVLEGTTFVPVQDFRQSASGHYTGTVYFNNYTGNGGQIAFRNYYTTSNTTYYSYVYLDDIEVDYIPTCIPVSGIHNVGAGSTNVIVDWTDNSTATSWEIEYGLNGFARGNGTTITATSHPVQINNLELLTSYDVYVRSICSVGDTAGWAMGTVSTTVCDGATIATTATSGTSTTTTYAPGYNYFKHSVSQVIIDSAELAGIGDIVAWSFTSLNGNGNYWDDAQIYMANSAKSEFTSDADFVNITAANGFVKVYDGSLSYSAAGEHTTMLDTAFVWDGHSNIIVAVIRNADNYQSGCSHAAASCTGYKTIYAYTDTDTPTLTDLAGSMSSATKGYVQLRPVYNLISCGASCAAPSVSVSSVSYEGATINWTGNTTTYEVAVMPMTSTVWPAETPVNGMTYTFTGLYPNTQYVFRVRALCDTLGNSNWTEGTFTTNDLPCFEVTNLRATVSTVSSVTLAWDNNAQSNAQAWVVNVFNASTNIFDTVSTNPATISGLYDNTDYYVSVQSMCAALVYSDWSDTISIHTATCEPVTGVAVSNVTGSTAHVAWNGTASQYEINWGMEGFPQGTGFTATSTSNSYDITGLEAYTSYDVYVRAMCAEGIVSAWSIKVTFETNNQGIDGVEGNYSLSIYPNPTSGNTTISLSGVEGMVTISVVDINGRTVSSEQLNCGADCEKRMDVSNLAQGTYFVRVLGDGINSVRKLVVR